MSFLSDSEWLCLNDLVLSINSIDSDREFRSTVLKKLRFLIPYESAAFFLSDLFQGSRIHPARMENARLS